MGLAAPRHVESFFFILACGIFWNQGSDPCPPALAGGFLCGAPPGKPCLKNLDKSQNKAITKDTCKESRLGVVGQDQSPLVSHCPIMAQQTFICQIFAFPSPTELSSFPLKFQATAPQIPLLSLAEDGT